VRFAPTDGPPPVQETVTGAASAGAADKKDREPARRTAEAQGFAAAPAALAAGAPVPQSAPVSEPGASRQAAEESKNEAVAVPAEAKASAPTAKGAPATPARAEAREAEAPAFDAVAKRSATTADEARALREAWRRFAAARPDDPGADEARVRVIETGLLAFRLGGDPADERLARDDARAYLQRSDAAQAERVRRLLASLERR